MGERRHQIAPYVRELENGSNWFNRRYAQLLREMYETDRYAHISAEGRRDATSHLWLDAVRFLVQTPDSILDRIAHLDQNISDDEKRGQYIRLKEATDNLPMPQGICSDDFRSAISYIDQKGVKIVAAMELLSHPDRDERTTQIVYPEIYENLKPGTANYQSEMVPGLPILLLKKIPFPEMEI